MKEESENNEKPPDVVAMFDQFGTTMENFAVVLKQYHSKLIEEGFSAQMANLLVREFQATHWNNMFSLFKK